MQLQINFVKDFFYIDAKYKLYFFALKIIKNFSVYHLL